MSVEQPDGRRVSWSYDVRTPTTRDVNWVELVERRLALIDGRLDLISRTFLLLVRLTLGVLSALVVIALLLFAHRLGVGA